MASASSRVSVRCARAAAGASTSASAIPYKMIERLLINEAENMALVSLSRSRLDAGPQHVDEPAQVVLDRQWHLPFRAQKDLEKHVALDAAEEHSCHDLRLVFAHPPAADLPLDEGRHRLERAQRRGV